MSVKPSVISGAAAWLSMKCSESVCASRRIRFSSLSRPSARFRARSTGSIVPSRVRRLMGLMLSAERSRDDSLDILPVR